MELKLHVINLIKILVPVHDGPTKEVKNITTYIEEFKQNFETPSEFINKKENFIKEKKCLLAFEEFALKEVTFCRYWCFMINHKMLC